MVKLTDVMICLKRIYISTRCFVFGMRIADILVCNRHSLAD